MRLIAALLDLLYPPRCVFCRAFVQSSEGMVCPACSADLVRADGEAEQTQTGSCIPCVAPLYYEGNVKKSLRRYKFHGASHYAGAYGPILAGAVTRQLEGTYDLITWVPLSRARLRERGYDQALLLARAAADALGERLTPTLKKVRNVQRQSTTGGAEARRSNIAGAYQVPEPERIRGKRILLIDDIVTTGSTLAECTRVLRAAGAAEVRCAALARARGAEAGESG